VNVAEYERFAKDNLPRNAFGYYASGANDMITLRENRAAYARLRLLPKILVDVSKINTETTILGEKVYNRICVVLYFKSNSRFKDRIPHLYRPNCHATNGKSNWRMRNE